jgi:predicted RNA-binding protein with RPS1 domain
MDFWQHLNASKTVDLQAVTEGLAQHLSELMLRGHSVADLLAHFADDFGHLPAEKLRQLTGAHRSWQLWRRRRRGLEEAREKAKLPPLPDEAFHDTPEPDQLDALVRTARLCPRAEVDSDETWLSVLKTGASLWSRCVALCRKDGKVHCQARDLGDPRLAAEFDGFARSSDDLAGLPPHRWLAMRRGQKEGVLELRLELPREAMEREAEHARERLGLPARERSVESVLSELVLDDLEPWLLGMIDRDAQGKAITAASESLAGLLRSQPVQARQLGAVYLLKPKAIGAAVVVDREGDLTAQKALRVDDKWVDRIVDWLQGQGVQQVVLPTSVQAQEILGQLEDKLTELGLHLTKIRTAALSEARRPLTDPPLRLGSSVASATVLARRALDPLKEWSLVDPVSIGVAEYQNDINQEQLRAALTDTVELCRLERRRGKRVSMGGAVSRGSAAMARLNPLVKTLADLRPGMSVHGVVTNISHFGAFVNIGLPQEALVHISELSDKFVSNPNEVVSIGQQVTAHVLAVDPGRGRISLSLKSQAKLMIERERDPRPRERARQQAAKPVPALSKAQALANLEKLFKK